MPVVHIHTMKEGEDEQKYNREKEKSMRQLNNYLNGDKDVFALVYMNGCGPCEATKPKWHEIKNKHNINDDVCVADIEHSLLDDVKNDLIKKDIVGFPTMRHIKGHKMQNYEDVEGIKKDRSLESFIHWLETREKTKHNKHSKRAHKSKLSHRLSSHHSQNGGSNKCKRSKRTQKRRGKRSVRFTYKRT